MAPNSQSGEEHQTFQHPGTLRRKDNNRDSSINESDLSRPTGEPSMKRPKLNSSLVPVDNSDDEDEEEEDNNNDADYNDDDDGEADNVQRKDRNYSDNMAKKVRRRSTTRKRNVAQNKMKRVAANAKRGNQRKSNASNAASEQVSLNELKKYMSSLLDEMKDTRGNLLTWLKEELKKTIAEEVASELQRRQFSFQVQQQKTGRVEEETHAHNTCKDRKFEHKSVSQQHYGKMKEHAPPQVQQTMSTDGVSMQLSNFDQNNRIRSIQGSINQQQLSPFWSSRRDQTRDGERFANINKRPSNDSMAIQPLIPTEKDAKETFVVSDSLTSPSGLKVQDQLQQKIALEMGARHTTSGMSERYRQGQSGVVDCSQPIVSVTPSTIENKHKARRPEFYSEPSMACNLSGQAPPAMYLTLPTVAEKSHGANRNHRPDVPSFTNRVPGVETSLSAQGRNLVSPGSGGYLGYLHDERSSRSFAPMERSRDMSYLRNSYMTSPIAASAVGLHQSEIGNFNTPRQVGLLEGLSRQSSHGVGLRNGGGGIRFPGGSYSLPLQHFPNNFH